MSLTDGEFRHLAALIERHIGIHMPSSKRTMLQARVLRRLHRLGMTTYGEYCQLLSTGLACGDPRATEELTAFLDVATTNKTSFFREEEHFALLAEQVLPSLREHPDVRARRQILLWSAACSTGEEPYSLAMTAAETLEQWPDGINFEVLATDVCTEVLRRASSAIYSSADIEPISEVRRRRWLLRSRDRSADLVRIETGLRSKVHCSQLNFVDEHWNIPQRAHVIFLRNVLIYFERERQLEIVNHMCQHLVDGGYLVVGLSESLHGLPVPLTHLGRSIHLKNSANSSVHR